MEPLPLDPAIDDAAVATHFRTLLDRLGGEWELHEAHRAWRAERIEDGVELLVGAAWCVYGDDGERWRVSWDARSEVPEDRGLRAMVTSLAASTLAIAVGVGLGLGGYTLLLAAVVGGVAFRVQARRIRDSLSDPSAARDALGRRVAELVPQLPWASEA